ncbi:MAG: universal stress protein [Bacteroidia bacterium]|nr:universal stress protein [Bacteroidia bacterium]
MKKLFVATDFSDVSLNAVKYAADLAVHMKASLTIIHVYESPMFYTAEMPYTAIEAAENLARTEADSKMNTLMQKMRQSHSMIEISQVIKRGISAETITETADGDGADLLIAGATGAGVVERTLVGSTTTALINKSKCQVLIVPEKATFKPAAKLVYTTDLKDDNIKAVNELIPFATSMNSELIFLFVDDKIHTDSEKISEDMSHKIRQLVHYPKTSGYICTDPNVMNGISLFLQKQNVDMVAMLTHPRKFPQMLWDKSLTKKFSYHPDVPLLVMHANH